MLLADDQRRWVTGNAAACELLRIAPAEIPWHTMDDFTPASERRRLAEQWEAFLTAGAAEGWYQLYIPSLGPLPVEFSATAHVLPARHLSIFIMPDEPVAEQVESPPVHDSKWVPVVVEGEGRVQLTDREREVMTLVASGFQSRDVAERLFLSPETIRSHVQNALAKLGARTRAHGVAVALVTGEIAWEL
jgi:DNA-binding CsgD family transcriptional regulator